MADISQYLQAIMQAIYGEEVRGSIHDAIDIINKVSEKTLSVGTDVTSASSPIEGYYDESLYINTQTDDLWQCDEEHEQWVLQGNIRGNGITSIVKDHTTGLVDYYVITLSNGQEYTFTVTNGSGDMNKYVYDTDDDGKVDSAENADYAILAGSSETDEIIAPVESSPSTAAYAIDEQLIYNGVLYKAKTAIAIGDTLTVGTNIEAADSLVAQIKDAGKGTIIDKTDAQYHDLTPAEKADPEKYYFVDDIDINGWVKTDPQTAYANSDTSLVFLHNSIKTTSLIHIVAEASDTVDMPLVDGVNNTVKPISARVSFQNNGSCGITFDKQPVDTRFWLLIRNMEGLEDQIDYIPNDQGRYSTNEIVVGMWIDGKPIYRKVIEKSSNFTSDTSVGSIPNISTIIDIYGSVERTNGRVIPVINANSSDIEFQTSIYVTDKTTGSVNFVYGTGVSPSKLELILEYTKTTD